MLISKEEFVEIINRFIETQDIVEKVNEIFNNSIDTKISDYMNASSLMICHEDIVVKLLKRIFNDEETLSWWLYERNYGRDFKIGDLEDNGIKVDLTTAEKLYDYLVKCYIEKEKRIDESDRK